MHGSTLLAILVGVCFWWTTSEGAPASPRQVGDVQECRICVDLAAMAESTLRADGGLTGASVRISATDLCDQINFYPSPVAFPAAVDAMVDVMLNDTRDAETPLAIALTTVDAGAGQDGALAQARAVLRSHLAAASTDVRLLAGADRPEGGESVAEFWLFELRIPTLSDHIYWAAIKRDGSEAPYIYGFN